MGIVWRKGWGVNKRIDIYRRISYILAMNFLYIDESGTPSFKDKDPIFCVIGLDIDESKNKLITYEYANLKKYYFPTICGIEPRSLPTMKDKINQLKKAECKEILKPSNFCYPHRTFMYKTINLCLKYNVKIFGVIAFKDRLKHGNPDWLYPGCIKIVTKGYNSRLQQKGMRGIIIMDSRGDALDDNLTFIQSSFLLWGKEGRQLDKVIDLPFFTPSHLSAALQIAHYFSYITALHYKCVYYKDPTYKYLTPLWRNLSTLFYGEPKGNNIIVWR